MVRQRSNTKKVTSKMLQQDNSLIVAYERLITIDVMDVDVELSDARMTVAKV